MNYGFITGLPRSGTGWIANYLSYGNCMFLHDAWKLGTPSEIKEKIDRSGVLAGGVADPANTLFLKKIDKEFPEAKWVVITRPPKEVEESCKNINFPYVDFTKQLQILMGSRKVLKVPFSKMFDRADEIGRFLYEDWSCPSWRKAQLKDLNVQLHWGHVSQQFRVPEVLNEAESMTPTKMEYFNLIKEITGGDVYAIRFMSQARYGSELYRRLDQGKPVDVKRAKELLEAVCTEWLLNPFVKNFSTALAPAMATCIEKYNNQPDLEHCPIDVDLVSTVTYIFKGNDGVKEYMPKIRELSDRILQEKH